jgi:hypothetical protein
MAEQMAGGTLGTLQRLSSAHADLNEQIGHLIANRASPFIEFLTRVAEKMSAARKPRTNTTTR